jgi:predicted ATPase
VEIAVLGPLELRTAAGATVPVAGARLRTLLILLALEVGRAVSADRLIDGVWGGDPPAAAGNALQALVSRLRRAGLAVEAAPAGYRLVADPEAVDAHRFGRLARTEPERALALWRGPLEFPDTARAEAARLEQIRLAAQRDALDARLRRGDDVVPELTALARDHPLDEAVAGLLMRALQAAGSPGRALEVYERTRRRLAETLGTDPSAELAALHVEVLRAAPSARGNLPAAVSSFVGRDTDVRTVRELIGAHRLVTLTGPGGSGKTRLSVEVGAGLPGAVWRVELAPVSDPAEIPAAVLTALGLRSQVLVGRPGRGPVAESVEPLARLRDAVAGREMLLILDNCEHLIAAAARVADEMLRAAPGLRLLTTSREPLGIPGEQVWPVEPLALPPAGAEAEVAAGFPAVRLLLDRAGPAFVLDAATARPVVRICRALDGMPLALELAAARLRTLPVDVLADRLADRFRLLTGGSRTALPRHRTLRAVVDWSWDLLGEPERALWRRFSVFHGGAGVVAVERVCGADIDLVGALTDKSLLVLDGGRYRMLETIREYGRERLAEAGEAERLRRAHATFLHDLAARAEPELRGADQLTWLRRLGEEHDNFHAAVRAAIDAGDTATATALAARLGWYWWLSGHRAEGATQCRDVLALTGDADPEDRALVFTFAAINGIEGVAHIDEIKDWFGEAARLGAGPGARHPALRLIGPMGEIFRGGGEQSGFASIAHLYDDPDPWLRAVSRMMAAHLRLNYGHSVAQAEAEMREALAAFRAIGERWGTGSTLSTLAEMAAARGEFTQAVQWQREAVALVREVGIREDLPQMEVKLAHELWLSGDRAEARRTLKQAHRMAEEVGLPEALAGVEYFYATIARQEGNLEEARERMERTAAMVDRSRFAPQFRAMTRSTRGLVEAAAGDLAAARELHAAALAMAVGSEDSPVIAMTLVGIADLALREGDPARAARMLGAADGIRGSADQSVPEVRRVTAACRAALGDAAYAAAYGQGMQVRPATVIAAAGLSDPPAEGPHRQRGEDQ